jgi:hypothetical protein
MESPPPAIALALRAFDLEVHRQLLSSERPGTFYTVEYSVVLK